jgi:hypothetical protein
MDHAAGLSIRAKPVSAYPEAVSLRSTRPADLEQNPSNSAHEAIVRGGFPLMKKPLDGRAFGYIYSDSAIVLAKFFEHGGADHAAEDGACDAHTWLLIGFDSAVSLVHAFQVSASDAS